MSVDKRTRELQMAWPGAYVHGAADGDVTLTPDQTLALIVPPTSSTTTVTLPNVFEARGRYYSIVHYGEHATGTVTVVGSGYAPPILANDGNKLVCFSDGYSWTTIAGPVEDSPAIYNHGAGDGDVTLTVDQQFVRVVPPTSSTTTVTLPNVAAARGRIYTIVSNGNDTGTVTVVGAGDESNAYAPGILTADEDIIICISDGFNWYTIVDIST